ncbi:dicarboxylate/amino acid:cation symporter [Candidatus Chlamydia sanziniae]|nr:dicarboxylate/amino acid:cation symporter [Candidatus Chlamydia sanziniae]
MTRKYLYTKYNLLLLLAIFLGLGLGLTNSVILFAIAEGISSIFLKLLRLISLPLVFFAIGSTITSVDNLKTMFTLGKRLVYYTLFTTLIAASIGLGIVIFIHPRVTTATTLATMTETNSTGYTNILADILPNNILKPFIEGNVIAIAFLAVILSIASLFLKEKERTFVKNFFSTFSSIFLNLAKGILKLLPLAMFAFSILLYKEFRNQENLQVFSKYLFCVIMANLLQGFLVLPLLLKFHKISPFKVVKTMSPALITAFFSKSSAATLPLTMELAEDELKIHPTLSRFSFPLCSVINMNGCAAFILITIVFILTSNGILLSPLMLIAWVLIATLAAVGNAGVPMGCYFLTLSLLSSIKIPLSILGLILPFYAVLDMLETSLNVWSDCCVVSIVNKQLSKKFPL